MSENYEQHPWPLHIRCVALPNPEAMTIKCVSIIPFDNHHFNVCQLVI